MLKRIKYMIQQAFKIVYLYISQSLHYVLLSTIKNFDHKTKH